MIVWFAGPCQRRFIAAEALLRHIALSCQRRQATEAAESEAEYAKPTSTAKLVQKPSSEIPTMPRRNYSIDLIRQMAECDANYIRLLKLVPQLQVHRDRSFSEFASHCSNPEASGTEQGTKQGLTNGEPEKILEGLKTEFCIADLDDCNEKVIVEIKILEAFKYTTTLEITQRPELKKWITNPSMLVRVYHDASTAEVVSYQGHRNFKPRYSQPNPHMYHADEKMQVNAFLGEWLTHCLKVGISTKAPDILFTA